MSPEILRYAAFTRDPSAGNPAGLVLDAASLDDVAMQAIAAEVGYSETAFLVGGETSSGRLAVRYFSPRAEVPFCGHATVALAVALAERRGPGPLLLDTPAGPVPVASAYDEHGHLVATLTSVEPRVAPVPPDQLAAALESLGWSPADLDPDLPPRLAYAGLWHLVVVAATRERLADLHYDMDRLGRLMADQGWTTVHLAWRAAPDTFHVRDPFPPGGVVEDPATGAAAAAFGAYLRELGLVTPPAQLTLHQGEDMGRPSMLIVDVPPAGPVRVTGTAVVIPD